MFDYTDMGGGDMVAQQKKKTASGESAMKDRRNIAVKLTADELKQLKQMALDTDSASVDIATDAIRKVLREYFSRRK